MQDHAHQQRCVFPHQPAVPKPGRDKPENAHYQPEQVIVWAGVICTTDLMEAYYTEEIIDDWPDGIVPGDAENKQQDHLHPINMQTLKRQCCPTLDLCLPS